MVRAAGDVRHLSPRQWHHLLRLIPRLRLPTGAAPEAVRAARSDCIQRPRFFFFGAKRDKEGGQREIKEEDRRRMDMGGVCFFEPSGRASGEESTPKFALRGFAFALRLENRAAITTGLQQTRDKSSANTLSSPKRYKVLNGLTGRYGHLIEGGFYLVIYRGRIAQTHPLFSKIEPSPRIQTTTPPEGNLAGATTARVKAHTSVGYNGG